MPVDDLQILIANVMPKETSAAEVIELARIAMDELEFRVGSRIADALPDHVIAAFDEAHQAADDEMMNLILETECPNFREVVREEIDRIVSEVGRRAGESVKGIQ